MITASALSRQFGNFKAVDALTMEVQPGEVFGFLGANGAGKTTAIRMLTGLLAPTSGSALVAGFDIAREPQRVRERIGYMSQKFSLYDDLTVQENMRFFGGMYGLSGATLKRRIEARLQEVHLETHRATRVSALPLGWKQRLAFSVARLHEPPVVFLDEPTGGVDPATRRQFWDLVFAASAQGVTVFVTTHYMDEASFCDRIGMMVAGSLVALDTPAALIRQFGVHTVEDVFVALARPTA